MLYQGHGKELIKKIKNGKNKALMAELVRNLIQKIPIEELKDLRGVIPTPAKVKGAKDHAYFLGQNISQYVGLPLYDDLLIKAEARESQKQGGIEWRQQVHFKLLREERALSEGVWILADDVITTGLTLLEMHKALGKPRTLCLTLATRPFVL
jgi:predicted amidophosphoribosyltransferase